ncbi:MAG: iron-containing alcohol dehydrogenase [Deltaproteobacteria bacterium]|jgi:alcohol dehydrogenase/1,3-propanediol dehydrogenase|nr:iron-containing alcohol dehydrogenase [Deltaproteobacteria bacterium]MCL6120136.1 iron-containing alcohol dehydrogenase [Deltaproteobacteria bacterium]
MKSFTIYNPVKIHFGAGIISETGDIAKKYSDNVLIVTGKNSMQKTGTLDKLVKILKEAGITVTVYDGITPNPTITEIDEAAKIAKQKGVGLIIGLGGGSPLDSAKAIAVAAKGDIPVWEYLKTLANEAIPVITVVSTSGTGSEVNRYSVMTNPATGEKPGFGYECMYPKEAIIDPEITSSMPPYVTASTGFDVFVHIFEAFTGKAKNEFSAAYCMQAFYLLKDNLINAYSEPDNMQARGNMALASALAGLAIDISGVGIMHAMEHPISGNYPNIAHGAGLAVLALESMKYNLNACKRDYMLIAHHFGIKRAGKSDDEYAMSLIEKTKEILTALNLNIKLKDLGVEKDKLQKIAKEAFATMGFAVENNPAEIDENGILRLLENSY